MASQRGIEVWDLKLLLEAAILEGAVASEGEIETIIHELQEKDGYRFSDHDRRDLLDRLP